MEESIVVKTTLKATDEEVSCQLMTEEAKILFDALPDKIWQELVESFKKFDFKSQYAQNVLKYFINNSVITELVNRQPSSASIFEFLYHKEEPKLPIDQYFVAAQASQAIYERLQAIKSELPNIIRGEIERQNLKDKEFIILNIGSGPSHEMIEILADSKNKDLRQKVKVICVDPDKDALRIGQKKVEDLNLCSNFIFISKELDKYHPVFLANMLLMVGILCPIPNRICVKILKNLAISNYATFNSAIVFSTVQKIMGEKDQLCDYIMRLAGWKMHYKKDEDVRRIALESGWKPVRYFFDRYKFNCMTVAHLDLEVLRKK